MGNPSPSSSRLVEPFYVSTFWDDLRFPSSAINPPGAVSDPDRDTTDGCFLFDSGSTETITGQAQLSHSWFEGSALHPHIHWEPTNTNTGSVLWRLHYQIADINGVFSAIDSMDVSQDGAGVAETHQVAQFAEIDMTGYSISAIVKWRLSRIGGSDTYNADAKLLEFDIHYQLDRPGSRQEYTK